MFLSEKNKKIASVIFNVFAGFSGLWLICSGIGFTLKLKTWEQIFVGLGVLIVLVASHFLLKSFVEKQYSENPKKIIGRIHLVVFGLLTIGCGLSGIYDEKYIPHRDGPSPMIINIWTSFAILGFLVSAQQKWAFLILKVLLAFYGVILFAGLIQYCLYGY